MTAFRRPAALGLLLLLLASPVPVLAEEPEPTSTRLYLLHADSGFHYWSPDPAEPEASALTFNRSCAEYTGRLCGTASATPLGFAHLIPFLPGGLPEGTVSWSPEAPLRFRFALEVDSEVPYTVHALAIAGGAAPESPPAVQTSPGIWEGTIGGSGSVQPGSSLIFGMVIRQPGQARTDLRIDVRTAGASWFEVTSASPIASASELVAASSFRPSPSQLVTEERALSFNDRDWESFSFQGDLSGERSLTVDLEREAAIVIGWFESVAEPFAYGVLSGNPNARKPTEMGVVRLRAGGGELSSGRYAASAVSIPAGPLTMLVEPQDGAEAHPYTAHVVVIYGDRTLASYRWRFEVPALLVRSPVAQAYQGPQQQIPSSPEVTTFKVSISSESPSPAPREWSIGWDVPGLYAPEAGLSGTRSPLRVVAEGERISRVTPTPAYGTLMASAWDTVFEGEVRYSYTPCLEETPECEGVTGS